MTTTTASVTVAEQATLQNPAQVGLDGLKRLNTYARGLKSVAMELTDAWGAAMFIMDPQLVEDVFFAVGFSKAVSSAVFESVRALSYVQHKQQGAPPQSEFTWHGADGTVLTLRGCKDLRSAMVAVDDDTVEAYLVANRALFDKIMGTVPEYTRHLMFSPEVAERVLATFGAKVTADRIYDLAWRYGGQVTEDLEGRRGVSTQFVRSLTLVLSAKL